MELMENFIIYFILYIRKIGEYMKKDLPKLYKGSVNHRVNNDIYYSKGKTKEKKEGESISINKLFQEYSYIFNLDVIIKTLNGDYHTKIAGKMGNNIITLDNDVIPISDIVDIIILSK